MFYLVGSRWIGSDMIGGSFEVLLVGRWVNGGAVGGSVIECRRWVVFHWSVVLQYAACKSHKRKLFEILREASLRNRPIHILKFPTELHNLGISSVA